MNGFEHDQFELIIFLFRYFYSFGLCILSTGLMWALLAVRNRATIKPLMKQWTSLLLFAPLLIFAFYFILTAKQTFLVTSLDSENNLFAGTIYKDDFDVSLNEAMRIATDDGQTGNVRFYASCRIADLLSTNAPSTKQSTLAGVAASPAFQTGFGGTNNVTCGFFNVGGQEGPFTVTEIINKRLERDLSSKKGR